MAWADLTFAPDSSIAKREREILGLSSTGNWTDKDDMVKLKLGNDAALSLKSRGFDKWTDYSSGEVLLDIIINAEEALEEAAEYLKLYFIYLDLSYGNKDSINGQKAIIYRNLYEESIKDGMSYVNLDVNHDNTVDKYSATSFKIGRNTR